MEQYEYQIFDSLDRKCGPPEVEDWRLFGSLQALQEEAEEEGSRLTYAIGKVFRDGSVTFDF